MRKYIGIWVSLIFFQYIFPKVVPRLKKTLILFHLSLILVVPEERRKKTKDAVLKQLRKVVGFSNGNLIKNADSLIAVKPTNKKAEWVGPDRVPEGRFAMSY